MRWWVRALLIAWSVFLVGALLYPLATPGDLALRDMLVIAHPTFTTDPRALPQDSVLALFGLLIDASYLTRALLVAAGAGAAAGAWWLVRVINKKPSAWAIAAGITIAVVNPWIIERLLQGQWSLVIAGWLLPAIAAAGLAGRSWSQALLVFPATLTPTGALLAGATAVFSARTWGRRLAQLAVMALASVPWIIAGFSSYNQGQALSVSAHAFAPRAEAYTGVLGSLVGLGGIWNVEATPASRHVGFALFGILLAIILATALKRCPRVLLVLAGIGFAIPVMGWLVPELLGLVVHNVPGGGLLRDSQKFLILALPAYVALAGLLQPAPAVAALACALIQIPDAPLATRALAPVDLQIEQQFGEIRTQAQGRDVFFPDRPSLTTRPDGTVIVDPATKALSIVEPGTLHVDGIMTDAPNPRYTAATRAWEAGDLNHLRRLQVGLVVAPDGTITDTGLEPPTLWPRYVGASWWPLLGVLLLVSAYYTGRPPRATASRATGSRATGPRTARK